MVRSLLLTGGSPTPTVIDMNVVRSGRANECLFRSYVHEFKRKSKEDLLRLRKEKGKVMNQEEFAFLLI